MDPKSGDERSCLHKEVPNTPHPTTAMSPEDEVAAKAADGENEIIVPSNRKKSVIVAMMDGSVFIDVMEEK